MRRNIEELQSLRQMAQDLGASFIILSKLLPYTEELKDEILYWLSTGIRCQRRRSKWSPELFMPNIDLRSEVIESLIKFPVCGDCLWAKGVIQCS